MNHTQRVMQIITSPELGFASREATCRALAMSERTLKRRLVQENTRFATLRDRAQAARLQALLADHTIPLAEVTKRMGYATVQSCARATQRLLGCSPWAYRKAVR